MNLNLDPEMNLKLDLKMNLDKSRPWKHNGFLI